MTNSSHSAHNPPAGSPGPTADRGDGGVQLAPALAALFPGRVVAAQLKGVGDPVSLFPEEAVFVQKAVLKRRQEFAAGRACARHALRALGAADVAILAAPDRQPVWPVEYLGSITHSGRFCAAVVARRQGVVALGIDSEAAGAVGRDLWSAICTPAELAWLLGLPGPTQQWAAALTFCAKEAFYKCQYPLTREWLDFHDLEIEIGARGIGQPAGGNGGSFSVRATRQLAFERHAALPWRGQYLAHDGYLTAAIGVPREGGQ